ASDVGTEVKFRIANETPDSQLKQLPLLTQEQVGRENGDPAMADEIAEAIRLVNESKPRDAQLAPEPLSTHVKDVTSAKALTITGLNALKDADRLPNAPSRLKTLNWKVVAENVGMGIGGSEIPASMYQAANPIFILLFGLAFTALWAFLSA